MKITEWPLSKLIALPSPFDFTFGPTPKVLTDSIQKIGITHSPQILESSSEKVVLISGKRRIQILHALAPEKNVSVRTYEESEILKSEAFHLNLFENLAVRKLNAIEKSNVLKRLSEEFKILKETLQKEYLALLDLPVKEETLCDYLALQKLDETSKELTASGILQVDTALTLLKFDAKERALILDLIQTLRLGVNPQKTLANLAWEIFKKIGEAPSQWRKRPPIQEILNHETWSQSQKWAKLEWELRCLRYPMLSELEARFKKIKQELKLPPSITLQNSPYFETSNYALQFRFKNFEEYTQHLSTLNALAQKKALKELFKLTGED